ncbi:MAG: cation:H+ antiporter [Paraglaciecola sp.]|jgi:cation:H+ antiporter
MTLPIMAIIFGFALLVHSAERFVEGAAISARYGGMSPLLIGMLVVGFGTSAPEMMVSVFAAYEGNPNIALGNAYGSNIINIALVLGITALISPIMVSSNLVRKELPLLLLLVLFSGWQLSDGQLSLVDAVFLLLGVISLISWSIYSAGKHQEDHLGVEVKEALVAHEMSLKRALFCLLAGLVMLLISAKILVWGAVTIAHDLGVSDLLIGLTVIALGTSLPELAASIAAVRKGEHDIAMGNVIGSNMFNLLAVVGLAGIIQPIPVASEFLSRDWLVMALLTLSLLIMAYGYRKQGRINRVEGGALLVTYIGYNAYLVYTVVGVTVQ